MDISLSSSGPAPAAPATMIADLQGTRPWVMLVVVTGYVISGIIVLAALLIFQFPGLIPKDEEVSGGRVIYPLIYLFSAAIYLTLTIVLHRYARAIRRVTADRDLASVGQAIAAQRAYWRVFGIMVLLFLCLIGLAVVFGIVAALMVGRSGTAA
jgi:hypothetical protein